MSSNLNLLLFHFLESYNMKTEIEMNSISIKELEREMMNEINEVIKKYQDKIKLAKGLYKVRET